MATTKATTLAHTLGGISSDISTAEINRLDGLTGDIQTQITALDTAKAPLASPTFTGTANISSGATFPANPTITLGSNATFPAGNVINLEVKQYATTGSETLSTTDSAINGLEFTYDVKEQTSKLYVAAYPLIATEHDQYYYSYVFSLRSSVDSYASTIGDGNTPQIVHYGDDHPQSQWLQYPIIISCFHDHNQNAGTTITYKIYGHTKSSTKGIYVWDAWGHTTSTGAPTVSQHAVIYEVAQ